MSQILFENLQPDLQEFTGSSVLVAACIEPTQSLSKVNGWRTVSHKGATRRVFTSTHIKFSKIRKIIVKNPEGKSLALNETRHFELRQVRSVQSRLVTNFQTVTVFLATESRFLSGTTLQSAEQSNHKRR